MYGLDCKAAAVEQPLMSLGIERDYVLGTVPKTPEQKRT
jgi:hypothetical protein